MSRSITAARLLQRAQGNFGLAARCHLRHRPLTVTLLACLHQSRLSQSPRLAIRSFSGSPTPPSSAASPPPSAAQPDESILAETARLVSPSSPSPAPSPDAAILYASPFISAVRRMKLFSLSSCGLSLLSAPLLLLLSSPTIPLSGRLAMCTAVAAFGVGTTLALTKFAQPYVIRVYSSSPDSLIVETTNVWARPVYRSVPTRGLRPLHNRLLSNVRALHCPPAEKPHSDYFFHADLVTDPLLKPLVEHSLPPPEEPSESAQQTEAAEIDQPAAPHQSNADAAHKRDDATQRR